MEDHNHTPFLDDLRTKGIDPDSIDILDMADRRAEFDHTHKEDE